jgi:hypothetical protein
VPGQPAWSYGFATSPEVDRWYVFMGVQGRSYCVETVALPPFEYAANGPADTEITVFRADRTTSIGSNDDTTSEPRSGENNTRGGTGFHGLSRLCWVAPASEGTFIRLGRFNSNANNYAARVVETTLFSNWFFLGSDYSAYTLLRNTTNSAVTYTITWRGENGVSLGTYTGTLLGNASTYRDARTLAAAVTAVNGTVEISHNGPPDAIVASTTVLSATTGLSFDSPFVKRQPW